MRISDWSSDVCSSDLESAAREDIAPCKDRFKIYLRAIEIRMKEFDMRYGTQGHGCGERHQKRHGIHQGMRRGGRGFGHGFGSGHGRGGRFRDDGERKSVVEGKNVSVRLGHGGRRIIKKKKTRQT